MDGVDDAAGFLAPARNTWRWSLTAGLLFLAWTAGCLETSRRTGPVCWRAPQRPQNRIHPAQLRARLRRAHPAIWPPGPAQWLRGAPFFSIYEFAGPICARAQPRGTRELGLAMLAKRHTNRLFREAK